MSEPTFKTRWVYSQYRLKSLAPVVPLPENKNQEREQYLGQQRHKSIPYLNRPGSSECQKLQQLCLDPGARWRHSPAHTTYLSTGNKQRIFWLIICWMIGLLFIPYSSFVRKQRRECLFSHITKPSVLSKESKCNVTITLQWQHRWHPHTTEVRQVILLTVVFEGRLLNYRG